MKNLRKLSKQLLMICLALVLAIPAGAESENKTVHIKNNQEFLEFAEKCRLDSFSRGMTVYLDEDLDLGNTDFQGIPIFTGVFLGQGHCISGLKLEHNGSVQGLFRYLGTMALVQDLAVRGSVKPQGSRSQAGGIAGSNNGTIQNCSFEGNVAGSERVGGIAGVNGISGSILQCTMTGSLQGNHFAGGIVGENKGLLKECTNYASVNDSAQENNVELSDVTMETLLNTEQANAVTDVAGIAGASSGVIRGCTNHGNIGYAHMGYNVGGIAGTQSGYIAECENTGIISGRKEVGGIAGQMEPILQIEFSEDTLQILQQQLTGASVLAGQASANSLNNASRMGAQISAIQNQSQAAKDAIAQLLPSEENPHLPDDDQILAAQNALADSMASIQESMQDLAQTSQQNMETAAGDFKAISQQISAMSTTLSHASEQLGGTVTDVSDLDTPEDLTGKVEKCSNSGSVFGDLNVGGIVGAIGMERDLDSEDDHVVKGERSLNFNSKLRSVITDCFNTGMVTGKKKNIGGIAGQMSMGLAKNCVSNSTLCAENGSFLGGIAGTGEGYIRSCFAKCQLSGDTHIGGIAGSSSRAVDCRAIVSIMDGKEKTGAILGQQVDISEEKTVSGNLYLVADRDAGGIDGISYEGVAAPIQLDQLLQSEQLPECFYSSDIRFVFTDGTIQSFPVPTGEGLSIDLVPEPSHRDGYNGTWQKLSPEHLENIYFDASYSAEYTPCFAAVKSRITRPEGKPVILLEGEFPEETPFALEAYPEQPSPENNGEVLECWKIPELKDSQITGMRISLPDSLTAENTEIMLCRRNGRWETVDFKIDKSFLIVPVEMGDVAVSVVKLPQDFGWILYGTIGFALVLVLGGIFIHKYKKKKTAAKITAEDKNSGNPE